MKDKDRLVMRFMPQLLEPRVRFALRPPRILIEKRAFDAMRLYVSIPDTECAWLGTAFRRDDGDFLIEETFLTAQEVSEEHANLLADGILDLMDQLGSQGEAGERKVEYLRFWGQSHVDSDTDASKTDDQTLQRFIEQKMPWVIRGIFNKLGLADFTVFLLDAGVIIEHAEWLIVETMDESAIETARQKIAAKLKKVPPPKKPEDKAETGQAFVCQTRTSDKDFDFGVAGET